MKNPANASAVNVKWVGADIKRLLISSVTAVLIVIVSIIFASPSYSDQLNQKIIALPNEAVTEKILDNGLAVLCVKTPHDEPVSVHVKIRAGSATEGEFLGSGISHFVEHMLFKGTAGRDAGDIEKEVKSYGGKMNGSVTQDITDIKITVPAAHYKDALGLIKDMVMNASFKSEEFAKEREVILKEIRFHNDEPISRLLKILNEHAYIRHPYRYPVIGYEEQFKALEAEDLVRYYRRMYVPNRMVIAVAGSIDPKTAIEGIETEFVDFTPPNYGNIVTKPVEPLQMAPRQATDRIETNLSYLAIGFHSTSLFDKDLYSMDVLASILGRGQISRLYRLLVKERKSAYAVSSWNYTPDDPGLFVITATLDYGRIEEAKSEIISELTKIAQGGVPSDELDAAKRSATAEFVFSLESADERANLLASDYAMTGSSDFSRRYVSGIQDVTSEQVKAAAAKYLNRDNMTIAALIPKGTVKTEEALSREPQQTLIKKYVLSNGLRLLIREDRGLPIVAISAAMSGGLAAESERNNGVSQLVSRLLLDGTTSRDEDGIKGAIESRGGSAGFFSGFNSFGVNIQLLSADLDLGIDILCDILTNSQFPQERIDREKTLALASIREEDDDIYDRGQIAVRKTLFSGSPYAMRLLGTPEAIQKLRREELMEFYRRYCVPENIVISVSGDLDTEKFLTRAREIFEKIPKGKSAVLPAAGLRQNTKYTKTQLNMDREQSLIILGFQTVGVKDNDKYALEVIASVLSGSSGRLFSRLRGEYSLAYNLGCASRSAMDTGYFIFYLATTKEKLPQAGKELMDEIGLIKASSVTDEELASSIRELITNYKIGFSSNSFFSQTSAIDELYGVGYDDLYKYEGNINKVTKEDLKRVAEKYFNLERMVEVDISGPGPS